jgi:hypothetical protein
VNDRSVAVTRQHPCLFVLHLTMIAAHGRQHVGGAMC